MIIKPRTDRPSTYGIISERANIKIERTTPWRFDMTVTEKNEARQLACRSSNDGTPLRMSVETDHSYHAEAGTVEGTGSLHSEQMDERYYWIGGRVGTEGEHEVMIDIRPDLEMGAPIIGEETR